MKKEKIIELKVPTQDIIGDDKDWEYDLVYLSYPQIIQKILPELRKESRKGGADLEHQKTVKDFLDYLEEKYAK